MWYVGRYKWMTWLHIIFMIFISRFVIFFFSLFHSFSFFLLFSFLLCVIHSKLEQSLKNECTKWMENKRVYNKMKRKPNVKDNQTANKFYYWYSHKLLLLFLCTIVGNCGVSHHFLHRSRFFLLSTFFLLIRSKK